MPIYHYFRFTILERYTNMSTMRAVDKNICRLCGEPQAVCDGRHNLVKKTFSDKIVEFAGVFNFLLLVYLHVIRYIIMLKRFIVVCVCV